MQSCLSRSSVLHNSEIAEVFNNIDIAIVSLQSLGSRHVAVAEVAAVAVSRHAPYTRRGSLLQL